MNRTRRVGAKPLRATKAAAAEKETAEERQGRKREKSQFAGTSKIRLVKRMEALSQPCSVRERSRSSAMPGKRKPRVSKAMTIME